MVISTRKSYPQGKPCPWSWSFLTSLKELGHYLQLKRSKFTAESNQNIYNVTLLSISENKTTCQYVRQGRRGNYGWCKNSQVYTSMVTIHNLTSMIRGGNQSKLNATIYLNSKGRLANIRERGIESRNQSWVPHITIPFRPANLQQETKREGMLDNDE